MVHVVLSHPGSVSQNAGFAWVYNECPPEKKLVKKGRWSKTGHFESRLWWGQSKSHAELRAWSVYVLPLGNHRGKLPESPCAHQSQRFHISHAAIYQQQRNWAGPQWTMTKISRKWKNFHSGKFHLHQFRTDLRPVPWIKNMGKQTPKSSHLQCKARCCSTHCAQAAHTQAARMPHNVYRTHSRSSRSTRSRNFIQSQKVSELQCKGRIAHAAQCREREA